MITTTNQNTEVASAQWDKENKDPWEPGKAMSWTIGMIIFYTKVGAYSGEVTDNMKTVKDDFQMTELQEYDDPKWYWIAFMLAYKDGKEMPGDIMPPEFKDGGEYSEFGKWLSNILCRPENRWTMKDIWKNIIAN